MSTASFADWNGNMAELGPLYPFAGAEVLLVILALIFWVGWHLIQGRMENRKLEEEARALRQGDNLHKVLQAEHTLERM
jgi:hypothetical protein